MNEDEVAQARAMLCNELAEQLEIVADLVERMQLEGWKRHFLRDAELLRVRAVREVESPRE